MSLKLYVDDIRVAPEGWQHAASITDAIAFLAMFGPEVDEISLDHDISHAVVVDGEHRPFRGRESFMAVAHYIIAAWNEEEPVKITIHSANTVAAEKMRQLFDDHGIVAELKPASIVNRYETEV